MLFSKGLTAASLTLLAAKAQAQHVIAHVIAGNTAPASFDWGSNIEAAKGYGIEAFALDVVQASFTDGIVQKAYDAVQAAGDFGIFLQFDYDQWPSSAWNIGDVQGYVSTYTAHPAQWKFNGKSVVSTFEGPATADQWSFIDSSSILFAPDWTSAKGTPSDFSEPGVGGALSWDVWPHAGQTGVADQIDTDWETILGDKTYIMGVAPWFYTKLEQFSKNWIARGAGLWHLRWAQVAEINPPIVEILTWNDFGESHYIGPVDCLECMPGSETNGEVGKDSSLYVKNNPHDGFAALLPAYIDAYKSGNQSTAQLDEKLVFAHTTNPVNPSSTCADDGSVALYELTAGGAAIAVDQIDVYVVLNTPAEITVSVGGQNLTPTPLQAGFRGVNWFPVALSGATGEVTYTVSRDGTPFITHTESPGISTDCSGYGGLINYNAVTGVVAPGSS